MAIKKYISPDSFKGTLRDNLRKITGQYWLVNPDGSLGYGDETRTDTQKITKNYLPVRFNTREIFGRGDFL